MLFVHPPNLLLTVNLSVDYTFKCVNVENYFALSTFK
jgi:hypothetical protein